MLYLWLKAFHLIAVIAWFAGLFYLPRLFVYHANTSDAPGQKRFKIMEYKLYTYIMTPAGLVATLLGVWMVMLNPGLLALGWFHAKLALVALLWLYHFMLNHYRKQFDSNANKHSSVFFRYLNEAPTVILIAVVILVIVKPF